MKILREYVWDTLRQNKRSGVIIMVALFLMTTLMSVFSGLVLPKEGILVRKS